MNQKFLYSTNTSPAIPGATLHVILTGMTTYMYNGAYPIRSHSQAAEDDSEYSPMFTESLYYKIYAFTLPVVLPSNSNPKVKSRFQKMVMALQEGPRKWDLKGCLLLNRFEYTTVINAPNQK